MSATYEIWLTDDAGRRIHLFDKYNSLSYSRTNTGYGTVQFYLPYDTYVKATGGTFRPDWRLDIWRSPVDNMPARREASFFLRKFLSYQRAEDNMRVVELLGRSPSDILRRQAWRTDAAITDTIDNIMKTIVSARFVTNLTAYSTAPTTLNGGVYVSTGEFVVDENSSDGPSITASFYLRNILDILKDLKQASFNLNALSSANRKIYFDVIEDDSLVSGGFGYRFRTYPDLRGRDRTNGLIYSVENGNIRLPNYYEDYLDQITSVFHYNSQQVWSPQSAQSDDQYLSRWNYIELTETVLQDAAAADLTNIYGELIEKAGKKILTVDFLSTPGSPTTPRSLYGVDWDMGDILPVKFSEKVINAEIVIVWVSLDANGVETISGKSTVGI